MIEDGEICYTKVFFSSFVASRALEPGTEVFFDYQLSAKPLPAWYAPVPAEVMWRIVDGA